MNRKYLVVALAIAIGMSVSGSALAQQLTVAGRTFWGDEIRRVKDHCDSLIQTGNPAATDANQDNDGGSAYSFISLRECRQAGLAR